MLITAVMITSVFSVSLSTRRNDVRADRRLIAEQAARQLTGSLQEYVTADKSAATNIAGIVGYNAPNGSWQFGAGTSVAETNNCNPVSTYALCPGSHTLTNYLPSWFEQAPFNAHAVYYVSINSMFGSSDTWVSAAVTWDESKLP